MVKLIMQNETRLFSANKERLIDTELQINTKF
jgi:hypothetical protein